jgi:hypothetical protein
MPGKGEGISSLLFLSDDLRAHPLNEEQHIIRHQPPPRLDFGCEEIGGYQHVHVCAVWNYCEEAEDVK